MFAVIEKKPQGKTCAAIVGITEEGAEIMEEYKGSPALDAGLLAAAQAVEHYEISRYGTLTPGRRSSVSRTPSRFLQETLEEEEATDEALTEIAKDRDQSAGRSCVKIKMLSEECPANAGAFCFTIITMLGGGPYFENV